MPRHERETPSRREPQPRPRGRSSPCARHRPLASVVRSCRVVHYNGNAVGRQANIEFQAVGAGREPEVEGGDGVLGAKRAAAAVRVDARPPAVEKWHGGQCYRIPVCQTPRLPRWAPCGQPSTRDGSPSGGQQEGRTTEIAHLARGTRCSGHPRLRRHGDSANRQRAAVAAPVHPLARGQAKTAPRTVDRSTDIPGFRAAR